MVSGSNDDTIKIWDVQTGTPLRTLKAHKADINSVAFSPDGVTFASGSKDNIIRLWDAQTGTHLRTFRWHWGDAH